MWGISWIPDRRKKDSSVSVWKAVDRESLNSTWDTIHFKILVSIPLSFCLERRAGRQEPALLCSVTPLSLVRTRMLTEFFLRGLLWSKCIVAGFSIAGTKYSAHIARSAFENSLVVSDVAPKYLVFLLRIHKSPESNFGPKTDYWFWNILSVNFGTVPWITPRRFPRVIPRLFIIQLFSFHLIHHSPSF